MVECYPIDVLPHVSRIFREFMEVRGSGAVREFYPADPFDRGWMMGAAGEQREALADALLAQNVGFGAGAAAAALANIEKLRAGARAVVTGQQVGLLGGPLLTLLKAATAVRQAREASAGGVAHVPVFWLATEDHDLDEVNRVSLLEKHGVQTLRAELTAGAAVPVGGVAVGDAMKLVLERASELMGFAPVCELLERYYADEATLGSAFGKFIASVFSEQGLVVIDASTREFHAMGAATLRFAIERTDELQAALIARGEALVEAGYHAQVLVAAGGSLLFLVEESGARVALRRVDGGWKAGARGYSTAELLAILESAPERLSPNALLRPVFQDTILPTAAYVGGPAEVAYFAQSAVLFERILGRVTPVLPRLSATLIEPAIAKVMVAHEIEFPQALVGADVLGQRLAARAMPIEGKKKLAAAGNSLDAELTALTEWMRGLDESLGRSADVSASKMRYQMNRLRRMAANFELQREGSLRKHAEAVTLNLFPEGHPQERLVAGAWFLAKYGDGLAELLVEHAGQECPGHRVIFL